MIRIDERPGWENHSQITGELAGLVTINEMVAARIPLRRYNVMMRHYHHTLPLGEEDKLKSAVDGIAQEGVKKGVRVQAAEGTADIVQRAPPMPELTH